MSGYRGAHWIRGGRYGEPAAASDHEWATIVVGSRWRNRWSGQEAVIVRIAPEPNVGGETRIYDDGDPAVVGNGWSSGWWLRCWEPFPLPPEAGQE